MDSPDYVSLATAADIAALPASTLRHWIDSGKLPASTGEHGRLVRLEDVWRLVGSAAENGTVPRANGAEEAAPQAGSTVSTVAQAGSMAGAVAREEGAADDGTAPVAGSHVVPLRVLRVRRRQRAIASNAAAFMNKLDELYRAQITAKDGEIAAKDDLIAELRLRAHRAEQQAEALEHRLMELQTPVAGVDIPPIAPAPPGLLARLFPWLQRT